MKTPGLDLVRYEAELREVLREMDKAGALKPLKTLMLRHLEGVPWKRVFLRLHLISEVRVCSDTELEGKAERELGTMESLYSFDPRGAGFEIPKGPLSGKAREEFLGQVRKWEADDTIPKTREIVLLTDTDRARGADPRRTDKAFEGSEEKGCEVPRPIAVADFEVKPVKKCSDRIFVTRPKKKERSRRSDK